MNIQNHSTQRAEKEDRLKNTKQENLTFLNSATSIEQYLEKFYRLKDPSYIRNLSIIAHVDHGKSTLTDNLLAESGQLNKELAGKVLATDEFSEEKDRGITINSTVATLRWRNHLINLIDSPGHVEFTGEVIKALRASDGAVLVIDCVDGMKTQTETVLAQCLTEGNEVVLYVNKLDLAVRNKFMSSDQIYSLLQTRVAEVNNKIKDLTDRTSDYFSMDKNVVFGSALGKWGTSISDLRCKKKNFKTVVEYIHSNTPESKEQLYKNFNLAEVLLNTCIEFLPSPGLKQKQKIESAYKAVTEDSETLEIPEFISKGQIDSPFVGVVTDINYDAHAGLLSTVRVLSGQYGKKQPLYSSETNYSAPMKAPSKISVVNIRKQYDVEECFTGTLVTMHGLTNVVAGSTITTDKDLKWAYPSLKYARNPIIAYALTPKKTTDLSKMLECVSLLTLEDPTLKWTYDDTTGEFCLYGIGSLHLDVSLKKLQLIYNIHVNKSEPIIQYSESLEQNYETQTVSVRTNNKLNDFEFRLLKLPDELSEKLLKDEVTAKNLVNECLKYPSIQKSLAKNATKILKNGCIYFDDTKGCAYMQETKETIADGITIALNRGFKLKPPIKGIGFRLTFAKIHETPLHRKVNEYAQAYRSGIEQMFEKKSPVVVEPVLKLKIDTPSRFIKEVTNRINTKRAHSLEYAQSTITGYTQIKGCIPLEESLDLQPLLMSITEGRMIFDLSLKGYEPLPSHLFDKKLSKSNDKGTDKDKKSLKK